MTVELGQAYDYSRSGRRPDAVAVLRSAAAERPEEMQNHLRDYENVVEARSVGGRCGCHVSLVMRDLLREAIGG